MVKRVAEVQISKDSSSHEEEDFEAPTIATAEALSQRKILKPRGRNLYIQHGETPVQTSKSAKILALNRQFERSVLDAILKDTLDLCPLVEKYIEYYKGIQGADYHPVSEKNLGPVSPPTAGGDSSLTLRVSTATLFQISHFKLNSSNAPKNTFKTNGPSFSFNKPISDPIFKLESLSKPSFSKDESRSSGLFESKVPSAFLKSAPVTSEMPERTMDEGNQEDVEEHQGNSPVFEPVVTLTQKVDNVITGEEDETPLISCKSKLFLLNPENKQEPYTNVGVGELKILQSSKVCRILVRAEGSSRVVLNARLLAGVTYLTAGASIKIPTANPDGSLQIYLARVKTQSLAEEVCRLLNSKK